MLRFSPAYFPVFYRYFYFERMSSTPFIFHLIGASISAAKAAGNIARDILKKGDLGIVEKEGKHDIQTEADRAAQRTIISGLKTSFPNLAIVGEEKMDDSAYRDTSTNLLEFELPRSVVCPTSLASLKQDDVTVWVDPLDGTAEYTQGFLDHVTVLIGISYQKKPIAGVINQPFFQPDSQAPERIIWGGPHLGIHGLKTNIPLPSLRTIVTTRSHSNPIVNDAIEACDPANVLRVGGAGHKVLLLLEGKANAYVFASPGTKRWDTCAPEALLIEAGGKMTDIHGNDIVYDINTSYQNSGGILGTINKDHDWYLSMMPKNVKNALK